MKKSSTAPATGSTNNNNKSSAGYDSRTGGSSSNNNNTKGSTASYKTETKYSLQGGGKDNKYSSEHKYAVKSGASETKYSSQEKYTASNRAAALERRASYKSVERRDNEANAARDREYAKQGKCRDNKDNRDTQNRFLSESKYIAAPPRQQQQSSTWQSSWPSADTSSKKADDKPNKFKYSTEERWSSKNFSSAAGDGGRPTFSSQTSTSSWEERNRGRAFPYDRDHELRRSQNRYDTDVRNLDMKYRKGVSSLGAVPGAAAGAAPGMGAVRGADAVREDHAGATGCHNCTLL